VGFVCRGEAGGGRVEAIWVGFLVIGSYGCSLKVVL
jgi:hypothetical protein